jgi:hypothetical protein
MKTFRFLRAPVLALLCVSAAGCGLFFDDPYVDVTVTPLNWIEIHYYNATREQVRRVNVRITGSGRVEVKSGTARRVSDSFAKDIAGDNVANYRERVYNVDAEHVREVFQDLVNGGLFDREKVLKKTKYPSNGRFVAVRAAFDNKTYSEPANIFETDPELAERIYNVVIEFNQPILGRKK